MYRIKINLFINFLIFPVVVSVATQNISNTSLDTTHAEKYYCTTRLLPSNIFDKWTTIHHIRSAIAG